MKIKVLSILLLLLGLSSVSMASDIPLISEVDFADASRQASKANKKLLFIYKQNDCAECDSFIADLASRKESGELQKFALYQVNTDQGIEVVCPDGLELSDDEFFSAKGIHGKLSLVFHDESGEVVYTHNGIPTKNRLISLIRFIAEENYAVDWESDSKS
ncbi:MAG: hypothetical protein OEZ33_06770 [Gammaproteobacteria bacterium]|nr:hypothetical protein [Gammaproteobacteria bacterium]MDH5777894.1 hypothetical protein [Gammaproteobacteria bacterium]